VPSSKPYPIGEGRRVLASKLSDRAFSHRRRGSEVRETLVVGGAILVALLMVGMAFVGRPAPSKVSSAHLGVDLVADCTQIGSCGGDPAGSAPRELITTMYFGYPNYGYICLHPTGSTCQYKLLSLDSVYFNSSGTYPIKAVVSSGSGTTFSQWISSAGVFANKNSASTTFTVTTWGYIGFTVNRTATGTWGGYVAGMAGNNDNPMVVSAVSGEFYVPSPTWIPCTTLQCGALGESLSIWVGMGGGFTQNDIWQAGVDVNIGWINGGGSWGTWIDPWIQLYSGPGSHSTSVYNYISAISPGDLIKVTVGSTIVGGQTYPSYQISDTTTGHSVSGHFSAPVSPPSDSAEWIAEDQGQSGGWGSALAVLPSTPMFHFVNPTMTATCSPHVSCPNLGSVSWLNALEVQSCYSVNTVSNTGPILTISQQLNASQLYNGLDEFNITYS
jgi:hypothetical protein